MMNILSSLSHINIKKNNTNQSQRKQRVSFKHALSQDTIEISGKTTKAKVFTTNINERTKKQIENICSHPIFKDLPVRIMPDTHAGNATVVGFSAPIGANGEIIPGILGSDIGCGMLCTEIDLQGNDIDFETLDTVIRLADSMQGVSIKSKEIPDDLIRDINSASERIKTLNTDKQLAKLGTLGSGNHFIELDKDSSGKVYLVIHTGSRNFGKVIADNYESIAKSQNPYKIEKLSHLSGDEAKAYLEDMRLAQKYARFNRHLIERTILGKMGWKPSSSFESVHNYIDDDNIIRKGAISAQLGEKIIIPLNMRDGALIAEGKGNPDWNYTAPHGAGRILSRQEASSTVTMDAYRKAMDGIYTNSVCKETLDEAPQVYKDSDEIERFIQPTAEVKKHIRPIFNFKNK